MSLSINHRFIAIPTLVERMTLHRMYVDLASLDKYAKQQRSLLIHQMNLLEVEEEYAYSSDESKIDGSITTVHYFSRHGRVIWIFNHVEIMKQ